MARTNQSKTDRQPRRLRAAKHPVIDNRTYPSTDEVGKLLNVPASRVRELKNLAARTLKAVEAQS
ncbi:MAG: hypothetical protein M3Y57_14665 [Acidobacteriota bacterium]|nr:hypothetical protein [Acidobacteriota bacterium]